MDQHEPYKANVVDDAKDLNDTLAREAAVFAIVVMCVFVALIFVLK